MTTRIIRHGFKVQATYRKTFTKGIWKGHAFKWTENFKTKKSAIRFQNVTNQKHREGNSEFEVSNLILEEI